MTAQEQMRKMLDELMGTKRDGEDIEEGAKFTDSSVCKSFIMGLCPFDLFHNTKLDLGPCHKYHSLALKADFEQASSNKDYGYDVDQLEHLSSFVKDCDRKVEVNKKRLEDNSEDSDASPEAMAVHTLNEKIGKILAESERLGAEGNVEESLALTKEVEELKTQKRKAEDLYRNTLPVTTSQQQKLRVCEICGAYLSLYDNDRRLADHFGGKLHMGFIKIRERLVELQESVAAKRDAREKEREERKKEREEQQEKAREERNREKDRDRIRDRNRNRDRRRRSRSRSRERSSRRERSRERKRDRSRSRERDRRRSDRESRNSRDSRRDRSRDRYRSRDTSRDRSRERRRSRDRNGSRGRDRSIEKIREDSRDRSRERFKENGMEAKEDGEIGLEMSVKGNNDEIVEEEISVKEIQD